MMSSNPWFNHPPMGAIGATGATSYGATGARRGPTGIEGIAGPSSMPYPYSALSPQAKQFEDREAEIERIARLIASTKVHGDDSAIDLPVVGPHFNFMRLPDGYYVIPQNDDYSRPVMPYWRTFYRAAEAVYEDRRK